jgi:AcrR family transcriptional regulator
MLELPPKTWSSARVTRGALYYHFRDEGDLFAAVLDEEQWKLSALAMAAAAAQPER